MAEALERGRRNRPGVPLAKILVKDSSYSRGHLKRRLFKEGVKRKSASCAARGSSGMAIACP